MRPLGRRMAVLPLPYRTKIVWWHTMNNFRPKSFAMTWLNAFPKPIPVFLPFLAAFLLPFMCSGQANVQKDNVRVQIADFRGKGYEIAGRASFQASLNDVVVVLVCGAGQDLIDATEVEIKLLIHEGFTRVAMVLSDKVTGSEEKHPIVAIIVNNENPSHMTGVSVHSEYRRDLRQSIQKAYKDYILPKGSD